MCIFIKNLSKTRGVSAFSISAPGDSQLVILHFRDTLSNRPVFLSRAYSDLDIFVVKVKKLLFLKVVSLRDIRRLQTVLRGYP
jgi:hypothetical protein